MLAGATAAAKVVVSPVLFRIRPFSGSVAAGMSEPALMVRVP